jgi:hypothetical protein
MVNPQRSGVRSDTRVCWCGLVELERSVLVIADRLRGTSDGEILLESHSDCYGNLLGKRY